MKELLPPELWQSIISGLSTIGAALLGRLVWHTRQVQKAERKFVSMHLIWELPIALGIGFTADGFLDWYAIEEGNIRTAAIIAISYLGPGGIEHLIGRYFMKGKSS